MQIVENLGTKIHAHAQKKRASLCQSYKITVKFFKAFKAAFKRLFTLPGKHTAITLHCCLNVLISTNKTLVSLSQLPAKNQSKTFHSTFHILQRVKSLRHAILTLLSRYRLSATWFSMGLQTLGSSVNRPRKRWWQSLHVSVDFYGRVRACQITCSNIISMDVDYGAAWKKCANAGSVWPTM